GASWTINYQIVSEKIDQQQKIGFPTTRLHLFKQDVVASPKAQFVITKDDGHEMFDIYMSDLTIFKIKIAPKSFFIITGDVITDQIHALLDTKTLLKPKVTKKRINDNNNKNFINNNMRSSNINLTRSTTVVSKAKQPNTLRTNVTTITNAIKPNTITTTKPINIATATARNNTKSQNKITVNTTANNTKKSINTSKAAINTNKLTIGSQLIKVNPSVVTNVASVSRPAAATRPTVTTNASDSKVNEKRSTTTSNIKRKGSEEKLESSVDNKHKRIALTQPPPTIESLNELRQLEMTIRIEQEELIKLKQEYQVLEIKLNDSKCVYEEISNERKETEVNLSELRYELLVSNLEIKDCEEFVKDMQEKLKKTKSICVELKNLIESYKKQNQK
ncbi:8841_t:CDS:2, partial [Entrophospora sp. SA101]